MKKLYIDIRFIKCILALTAGWLMAGCSAEDELGKGSAAQQLSMTPMINDLQQTRVREEENLNEKNLLSLDFKMFEEPTSSELRIDRQFNTPVENKAEELGSGNWKSALHLDADNTYPYYAVANAKDQDNLKGKNLAELLTCTQQDEDIWKPATMVSDKKFLMSSQGKYTITQDPEQNIPVELVRAAAKIKLNISSTVKDYNIKEVKWKFINYNTNTAIFAGQPVTPNIIKDNQENKATAEKDEKGNDIYKVTTYSYSTTWNGKDDMPQFVADVTFNKNTDANTTITKHLVIPVRNPQGEKKLDRNYIYTVNAVIKYLDTKTDIDYDDDLGYLKWQITKWTQGEKTEVKGDKADYLIVYPTTISMKGMDDNKIDESIKWMASAPCKIEDYAYYSFDSNGTIHENDNSINQPGGAESQQNTQTGDGNCGYIKISDGYPAHNTVVYCTFNLCVTGSDKKQKIIVKKYPSIYSLNVESTGTLNQWQNKRLYTIQHSVTKSNNSYSVAKPSDKNDNTVSPAFIIASTNNSRLQSISSNDEAKNYCEHYTESATTRKGKNLDLSGWRLPTKEEVKKIISLQSYDKVIPKELLLGESYWTFDGEKSDDQSNTSFKGTYVRCVHDLTPDEIEKIEDQGID